MKKVIKLLPRLIALGFTEDVDFKITSPDGYADLEWLNGSVDRPSVQELLATNDTIGVIYDLYTKVNELIPNPDCVFNEYDDYADITRKWKDSRPIPSELDIKGDANILSIEKKRAVERSASDSATEQDAIITRKVANDLLLGRLNPARVTAINTSVTAIEDNAVSKVVAIQAATTVEQVRRIK